MTLKTGVMMLKIQLCFTGIHFKIENQYRSCNSLRVQNITGFIFLYFDQINKALMSICDFIKKQGQLIRFIIT